MWTGETCLGRQSRWPCVVGAGIAWGLGRGGPAGWEHGVRAMLSLSPCFPLSRKQSSLQGSAPGWSLSESG